MPKATMNEYHFAKSWEDEIGGTTVVLVFAA